MLRELGWDEEVYAQLLRAGEQALQRGLRHLRSERLDDAVDQLTMAVLYRPENLETCHSLALAYERRHLGSHHKEDRDLAEVMARRCLAIDPEHQASSVLLQQLAPPFAQGAKDKKTKSPQVKPLGFGIAAILFACLAFAGIGIAAGLLYALTATSIDPTHASSSPKSGIVRLPPKHNALKDYERNIEVELHSQKIPGLALEESRSVLATYETTSFYSLSGLLRYRENGNEIKTIKLLLEMVDKDDKVVARKTFKAPASHETALRPGDAAAFYQLEQLSASIDKVRLKVLEFEEGEPAPYPKAKPAKIHWTEPSPAGVSFAMKERKVSNEVKYLDKKSRFHDAQFELTNTGKHDIHHLKVEVRYLDKNGEEIAGDETYVVSSSEPPIKPGATRVFRTIETVPVACRDYKIYVLALKY